MGCVPLPKSDPGERNDGFGWCRFLRRRDCTRRACEIWNRFSRSHARTVLNERRTTILECSDFVRCCDLRSVLADATPGCRPTLRTRLSHRMGQDLSRHREASEPAAISLAASGLLARIARCTTIDAVNQRATHNTD